MKEKISPTQSDLRKAVTSIVATQLNIAPEEVLGDASIMEDLDADSFKVLEMTIEIENRFRVHLQEEAARKPFTVNVIVDKLMARLSQRT